MLYYRHASSREHDPSALAAEHPDVPARIEAIEAAMQDRGWAGCDVREAPAATADELGLVHAAAHIEHIQALSEAGGGRLDDDTYVTNSSYEAALRATGGACAMVRALVSGEADAGFCGLRPSGHHAGRDSAMGFCLFNNIAVAAELAIRRLGVERILILDWDVHHGNGTADIFRRRKDVLVASSHQLGLFPHTGAVSDAGSGDGLGYTVNVPVPRGADEEVWVSVLEHVIIPVAKEYQPQLVLISAGFDAHRDDPLGDCLLEASTFSQMACHVRDMAREQAAPVGAVLEGGYAPKALAACVAASVVALDGEGEADSIAPDRLVTSRIAAHVGHYWTL